MATKQATAKLPIGTSIVVCDGVDSPDFSDVSFAGWAGTIVELSGKKSDPKYIIEWDDATYEAMPASYRSRCEEQHLFDRMAYVTRPDIEPADNYAS
jgi:hypothetical protein